MKTKLLLTLFFTTISYFAMAQPNTVSNGNFESWTTIVFENPLNYELSSNIEVFENDNPIFGVNKVTDAQSGSFAVNLLTTTSGMAYFGHKEPGSMNPNTWYGGIPYNENPTALTGYYKATILPGDKAIIGVNFSVGTTSLGFYSIEITASQTTYTPFTISIPELAQTPDAINVVVASSDWGGTPIPGNMLQLDNISFTGVSSQPALLNGSFEQWKTFTNHKPDDWNLQTEILENGTARSTDAFLGTYAVELKSYLGSDNVGLPRSVPAEVSTGYYDEECSCMMGGYPYTLQNGTFAFHYKYMPYVVNEKAYVHILFKKNGVEIGGYGQQLNAASTYQLVAIPFNLPEIPDTVIINFQSSDWNNSSVSYVGSKLTIDNVRMFQPPNDLIVNAKLVSNNTYTDSNIDPQNANAESGNAAGCGTGTSYKTVFYKFQATSASVVTATITNIGYPKGAIFYEAPSLNVTSENQLTYINSLNNPCSVGAGGNSSSITATTGKFYYIVLINSNTTDLIVTGVNSPPDCTPSNDLIANAKTVSTDTYTDTNVNPQCGLAEVGNMTNCGFGTDYKTVFYKFQATLASTVTANISDPVWPNAAIFYEAPNLNVTQENQLTYINVPSNICSVASPSNSIQTTVGKFYYIVFTNQGFTNLIVTGVNQTLGLEELEAFGLKYYPNPVLDQLTLNAVKNITHINICNLLGQEMFNNPINQSEIEIDMRHYSPGVYFVSVEIEGKKGNFKVIKN